jgi:SAM-dependent methyltransferase
VSDAELERIRTEYRRRDAAGAGPYRWDNPGYVTYMHDLERSLLRAFADAGVELTGASVLDVGCGGGYFLHRLREYGAGACHGIDLVEQRIAEARERYPELDFRVGSATELPFERGEIDLATQFTCLSSILDDDVRTQAAAEMLRVAAGGWVLSFDLRSGSRGAVGTPSVGLGPSELRRLFGAPVLLRRVALRFPLAQIAGRHYLLARALGALPRLRSHYLGLWRVPG